MSILHWFKNVARRRAGSTSVATGRPASGKRRGRRRLTMESLERRVVFSVNDPLLTGGDYEEAPVEESPTYETAPEEEATVTEEEAPPTSDSGENSEPVEEAPVEESPTYETAPEEEETVTEEEAPPTSDSGENTGLVSEVPSDPVEEEPVEEPLEDGGEENIAPTVSGLGYDQSENWVAVFGTVADDQDPHGLTVYISGVLGEFTATVESDGTWVAPAIEAQTVCGWVYAYTIDAQGLQSPTEMMWVEIYA